jgi:hypothetical protein
MEAPFLSSSLQVLAKGVPPTAKLVLPLRHAPSSLKGCSVMLHCGCRDIHAAMQLVGYRERIRRVPPGYEWIRHGYISSEQGGFISCHASKHRNDEETASYDGQPVHRYSFVILGRC